MFFNIISSCGKESFVERSKNEKTNFEILAGMSQSRRILDLVLTLREPASLSRASYRRATSRMQRKTMRKLRMNYCNCHKPLPLVFDTPTTGTPLTPTRQRFIMQRILINSLARIPQKKSFVSREVGFPYTSCWRRQSIGYSFSSTAQTSVDDEKKIVVSQTTTKSSST